MLVVLATLWFISRRNRSRRQELIDGSLVDVEWLLSVSEEPLTATGSRERLATILGRTDRLLDRLAQLAGSGPAKQAPVITSVRAAVEGLRDVLALRIDDPDDRTLDVRLGEQRHRLELGRQRLVAVGRGERPDLTHAG